MKSISFLVLLLVCMIGSGEAGAIFYSAPLLRMYRTINGTLNDNFYTTWISERDYSISCCGYTLPTSGSDFIGFVGQSFYVNNSETGPFQRFYKGAPQTEHFYTSSAGETQFVLKFGYQYEGIEGRVFTAPVHGTTKLYRLSYGYPNGDLKHFYSADLAEINSRLAAGGWGLDTGQPGVPNEYIWPVPAQVDRATVSIGKFCNFTYSCSPTYVVAPSVLENFNVYFGNCGGIADVFIDGNYYRTIGHADWRYGILPGSGNIYGCHFEPFALHGTHQVRIEYSGYSGYFSATGIYWYILPSFSKTLPFNF